jgi:hypothetical protein
LKDLAPWGTDAEKPFLEVAPRPVVVCMRAYVLVKGGQKHPNCSMSEIVVSPPVYSWPPLTMPDRPCERTRQVP